jgi:hypothetical protein
MKIHAPTAGWIGGAETILATACHKQFHCMGWYQMFLGCITIRWGEAYQLYTNKVYYNSDQWITPLIELLWQSWCHCTEESARQLLHEIQLQIKLRYADYQDNPNFILQCHQYLF